jgi:SET domain-containing protein
MFMRAVQQNVFLILHSVPVTSVTDPELIRPSIPVMTHSLDQKVVARKVKARKCTAEVAGNVQAKVERQHRLMISFSVIPPSRSIPQRYTEMCVICPHNSAGMVSFMWCQTVKISPAPNDMFT